MIDLSIELESHRQNFRWLDTSQVVSDAAVDIKSSDSPHDSAPVSTFTPARSLLFKIPRSLHYFDGHFPEMPILPAVGLIDISIFFLTRDLKSSFQLSQIKSAKFIQPIIPDMDVQINYEQKLTIWYVEWILKADQSRLAELVIEGH